MTAKPGGVNTKAGDGSRRTHGNRGGKRKKETADKEGEADANALPGQTGEGKGDGKGGKGEFKGSCYNCGTWGHSARFCSSKGKGPKGRNPKSRSLFHIRQVVLLNVGGLTKGRQEAWRLHNRAWRLQNRGWRLQNRALEAPKSRPGGSQIEPRALQDAIFKRHVI